MRDSLRFSVSFACSALKLVLRGLRLLAAKTGIAIITNYYLTDDSGGVQSAGMGTAASETVKEIVRIAANAGMAKEVIGILEKKAALLAEQVAALESERASLRAENADLKAQLRLLPEEGEELSRDTKKILKLFFDRACDISTEEILKSFNLKPSVGDYHIDVLLKKKFIRETTAGMLEPSGSGVSKFGLTTLGRRYVLEHKIS
jgi:predicted phage gp36 major capsid-like protein